MLLNIINYYTRIPKILLGVVLLFNGISHASTNKNLYTINSNVVVGLLKIEGETYPCKVGLSQNIYEMFNNWKVRTVLIDYDKIINLKEIQVDSLSLAKQDERLARRITFDKVKIKVAKFIEEHKINRIFIPGDYCNLYSESLFPASCCQLIIEAIVEIVDNDPAIHLLAICGGLQGIMNVKGIKVVNVANLMSDEEKQSSRLRVTFNLQRENVSLQQIRIIPNSRLAKVVAKFLLPDENGWFSTYFPDTHSGAVSNTLENRRKLELFGYKVAAFSNNGVIEAIEDKHGNIYFQSHLEALIIKSDKNNLYLLNYKICQIPILVVIAIINDFLYRV